MVRDFSILFAALSTISLAACPAPVGDDDDTSADDDDFVPTEEATLADGELDADGTCDWTSYWPALARTNPVFALGFEAPEPPYEIRSLSVTSYDNVDRGYGGQDCRGDMELRVFAFVHDSDDLDDFTASGADWPELPARAEGIVSGEGDGDPLRDVQTVEFDPPVRVDEPGTLWVAYEMVDESGDFIACVLGCEPPADVSELGPAWSYQTEGNGWGNPTGWRSFPSERADLRVTIGY